MNKNTILIPIFCICMAIIFSFGINRVAAASGDTIYVNGTGGSDTANGFTWATAKLSIKNGIETVNSNGQVYIANGKYTGVDNTGITISKNMTITGQSGNKTIINGEGKSQIFHIYPSDVNVTIQNLRFVNGYSTFGGAIANDANCTIKGCTFIGNTASNYGGAIANFELNCYVENCTFINNKAFSNQFGGGAICNAAGKMSITGCNFINNTADFEGGAILNGVDCTANFNRFYGNTAQIGTAIGNYGKMNAENNWWSSNSNPKTIPNLIMVNSGSLTTDHWVILTMNTDPKTIYNGKTSTVKADLNHINGGGQLIGGQIPDGPITLNIQWGSFTNPTITHSLTANTINGAIKSIFYANQGHINPNYNPVKATATVDEYITNNTESAYIQINKTSNIIINGTSPETSNNTVQKTTPETIIPINEKTIPMQPTGTPLIPLLIGALMTMVGITNTRKN